MFDCLDFREIAEDIGRSLISEQHCHVLRSNITKVHNGFDERLQMYVNNLKRNSWSAIPLETPFFKILISYYEITTPNAMHAMLNTTWRRKLILFNTRNKDAIYYYHILPLYNLSYYYIPILIFIQYVSSWIFTNPLLIYLVKAQPNASYFCISL